LRVAATTDIHRCCCQKLLSNPKTVVKPHDVEKGQIAGVSGPRFRRQLTLGPDSIATFIWMIAGQEFFTWPPKPSSWRMSRPTRRGAFANQFTENVIAGIRGEEDDEAGDIVGVPIGGGCASAMQNPFAISEDAAAYACEGGRVVLVEPLREVPNRDAGFNSRGGESRTNGFGDNLNF
jgi:hypothetical protein